MLLYLLLLWLKLVQGRESRPLRSLSWWMSFSFFLYCFLLPLSILPWLLSSSRSLFFIFFLFFLLQEWCFVWYSSLLWVMSCKNIVKLLVLLFIMFRIMCQPLPSFPLSGQVVHVLSRLYSRFPFPFSFIKYYEDTDKKWWRDAVCRFFNLSFYDFFSWRVYKQLCVGNSRDYFTIGSFFYFSFPPVVCCTKNEEPGNDVLLSLPKISCLSLFFFFL